MFPTMNANFLFQNPLNLLYSNNSQYSSPTGSDDYYVDPLSKMFSGVGNYNLNDPFSMLAGLNSGGIYGLSDLMGMPGGYDALGLFGGDDLFGLGSDSLWSDSGDYVDICSDSRGTWGDPHYNFKDGTGANVTIDHYGIDNKTYKIFEGDGITVDGKYVHKSADVPQVVGAVRVTAGGSKVECDQKSVKVDGQVLQPGQTKKLKDGTRIEAKENGNVVIHSRDGNGKINITNHNGEYEIDPSGGFNITGGILGLFHQLAKAGKSREDIMKKYDTNGDGVLRHNEIGDKFLTKDIKFF